ncbi:GNAT family N-acetyltransferase [Klugiella xanthotipulae]|uniref:Acetyltransferase (GNAT) family protein n=1 Tax=Klugiella xanthotipulae TaxID=244735 RepID=A0A543HZA2_9MICO|nr:GNAT family N-acetyltransferase [Klugiella xanthotipulae]TQM63590.1 acetyltransferase (GNAT) family protein [Klugiella xanthotipulae]
MSIETIGSAVDECVYVSSDDPLTRPLFAELEEEYDTRYGDMLDEPASVELNRYPHSAFERPEGAFLLILRSGEPVAGGGYMRHSTDTAELKRIWTHHAHRQQGLAQRVVRELEAEATRAGYRHLYLTTGPLQPEAQHLYLRLGYEPLYDLNDPPTEVGLHAFRKSLRSRT